MPDPIFIRPGQAPAIFGVSKTTIYKWAREGHIQIIKRGRMSFVRVDELKNFIMGIDNE